MTLCLETGCVEERSFRICRTRMYKCRERRNGLLTPLTYVRVDEAHQSRIAVCKRSWQFVVGSLQ